MNHVFLRRLIALLMSLLLMLPLVAAGEEDDEELDLEDVSGVIIEEFILYDEEEWSFPVALEDLDPVFIVLANKQHLLDKNFVATPLVTVKTRKVSNGVPNGGMLKASGGTMQLQATCAAALVEMSEAAMAEGYKLYLKSAYRSYKTQNTMYQNRLAKNKGKDDGWVSKPGASDHQTGLGCDVVPKKWTDKGMNEKMAAEPECIWMAAHCAEYGFIIRYPEDKQDITEINYEPWHLRYVGKAAAAYIMEHGLCLEEFWDELNEAALRFINAGGRAELVEGFMYKD